MTKREIKTSAGRAKYRWEWQEFKYLVYVLTKSKDFKDILNLFIDLHTTKEITEIIRRVIIASYLIEGKTYEEIAQLCGASFNTISKISSKMLREKEVLSLKIKDAGTYEQFKKMTIDERDWLSKFIDNTLNKRSLIKFGPKN